MPVAGDILNSNAPIGGRTSLTRNLPNHPSRKSAQICANLRLKKIPSRPETPIHSQPLTAETPRNTTRNSAETDPKHLKHPKHPKPAIRAFSFLLPVPVRASRSGK